MFRNNSKIKIGCSFLLLVLVLGLTSGCYREPTDDLEVARLSDEELAEAAFLALNDDKPGTQIMQMPRYLAPGRYTIVYYFSPYSEDTAYLTERLQQLTQSRSDVSVRTVNVNRPDVQEVDWQSPIMVEDEIPDLPYFRIYDPRKQLRAHGRPASEQVMQWIK